MLASSDFKRRLGIIDLGSNFPRLIVVRCTPFEAFKITYKYSPRGRLAEGMTGDDRLQPAALERAIETLRMFREFCSANGVARLVPVATAAGRDAVNWAETKLDIIVRSLAA